MRSEESGGDGGAGKKEGEEDQRARRWLDNIKNDLSERELSGEDEQDRAKWRRLIRHIDPT